MESKNLNYGKCRCCLTKGYHKDIMKEYFHGGIKEVYFDMIMECFNLFLSTNSDLTTLICVSCINRLRDANHFRTMVVGSEQKLLGVAAPEGKDYVFVNVCGEENILEDELDTELGIKYEDIISVKEEPLDSLNMAETDDDFDIEAGVIDLQETPEDQCELVDGEAALLTRWKDTLQPLPTRRALKSICPAYYRHLNSLKGMVIVPRMIKRFLDEASSKKAFLKSKNVFVTEKLGQIVNIANVLENSNIIPFRSKNRSGFPCFYCRVVFENLDKLKEHTQEHKKSEVTKVLKTYGAECLVVYADVSDLTCTLCKHKNNSLNELKSHLVDMHKKKFYTEFTDRIIPFKLTDQSIYECQLCGFKFETFGAIERHMNVHFRNYVCKDCGTGFVTKYRLKVHVKSMHAEGCYPCEECGKVFTTPQKHKNHVDTVHKMVKRFKCTKCPERFSEYFRRQKHMVEIHGVAPLSYKCNVCDKSFDRRYTLSRHMKRDHLEERDFQCELCSYKCFTNNELRVHMVKHNGERIFECSVCKKSYARKKTLKEHMRIHNNDRRFACAVCGQAFVQKCSLKGHLKTHHLEYAIQ